MRSLLLQSKVITFTAKDIIYSGAVKLQFADIFRHKLRIFQFDYQIAVQKGVIHQYVNSESKIIFIQLRNHDFAIGDTPPFTIVSS